ncbi:ATP-dependent DNA helicase [Pararobbsia silviterrae]|uniref:ATP-dependent DNA helicase n=1 Tax=Pararobbsia silviterrae TaxID=1792498 RepID=A0A494Y2J2_9BURK|nr:ATP-dependent DNA helicase [Pararobbsia silviterrae]RKP55673.1 ATP-dependent DNA helicase [Pararobbsia silviterrae]
MTYTIAVRALCEFTAREGDLDLRFTPAPTAQEGIAGHALVAGNRTGPYETEVALNGRYGALRVRGRADGFDPVARRVEEVKTYRGEFTSIPDNHRALHWAQARIYAHLLCEDRELDAIEVSLVYFEISSQKETSLVEKRTAAELAAHFDLHCARFLEWAQREQAHRAARNAALETMPFPRATFRPGQRELAVAVYRTAQHAGHLLAQAPTGIGKTLGTLFPALKACPGEHLDKLFYLAAKSSGRALALDAIDQLRDGFADALPTDDSHDTRPVLMLRTLELVARDKACEYPDNACHGESCPLARGFYDRLPAAREAAVAHARLDRATMREVALAHDVCPYYLSQEMARWADIVVGDYNYYFDTSALLYALTLEHVWRVGVLVDEAHNLVDRARAMYTASLDERALKAARQAAPVRLRKSFDSLKRQWNAVVRDQTTTYLVHDAVPVKLLNALQNLTTRITDHLAESAFSKNDALLAFYFDALHFGSLAQAFGSHSLFDVTLDAIPDAEASPDTADPQRDARTPNPHASICVRNVIPAHFLAPRYVSAHMTVMFSGTLSPFHFYRDTLGLPDDTRTIDVPGPFRAEQLSVNVVSDVSTRWRDRERSLEPIVDVIAAQYARRPGNYLGFLSSFDYLKRVTALLRARHPALPVWEQTQGMDEARRTAFLERFQAGGQGIGFAVLGGAFSEGIDLPGERLIGAFIATLGLPQLNAVNEAVRRRMHERFGNGYDYTYLYPGLQKVVQAAGRVIRTECDVGSVHLIDDRYRRDDVQALLPSWWRIGSIRAHS